MNVWKSWTESKGLKEDIVKYEAKELDESCLSRFFAEIRKSDGSDYELDRLRVMLAAIDRHLKQNDSKISIAKDREFVKCRQGLEEKARALREKGHRKQKLTVQDEEQLWKNRVLSEQNPNLSSLPIQHNRTATPASQTVVHHFHGCHVAINYGAGVGVFQQSSN